MDILAQLPAMQPGWYLRYHLCGTGIRDGFLICYVPSTKEHMWHIAQPLKTTVRMQVTDRVYTDADIIADHFVDQNQKAAFRALSPTVDTTVKSDFRVTVKALGIKNEQFDFVSKWGNRSNGNVSWVSYTDINGYGCYYKRLEGLSKLFPEYALMEKLLEGENKVNQSEQTYIGTAVGGGFEHIDTVMPLFNNLSYLIPGEITKNANYMTMCKLWYSGGNNYYQNNNNWRTVECPINVDSTMIAQTTINILEIIRLLSEEAHPAEILSLMDDTFDRTQHGNQLRYKLICAWLQQLDSIMGDIIEGDGHLQ